MAIVKEPRRETETLTDLETEAVVVEAIAESHKTTDEITETTEEIPEETPDDTPDQTPDETPDDVDAVIAKDTVTQEPVREVYSHKCAYDSCPARWSKYSTVAEEEDALNAEICNDPIVHRRAYTNEDGWHTVSFAIQCPEMRAFLSEALANYQDLDPELEGWSFEPPYSALVHRWDRIQTMHQELADSDNDTRKLAVDQLVEFMQPILASSLEGLATTRATGMVNYSTVWQIFSPGEIVVTKLWGIKALCRVLKYQRDNGWHVDVEYVDWDGRECGFERATVRIRKFSGYARITSLRVFPLSFAENPDQLKATMAARGRRFQELRGYQFLNYNGVKLSMDRDGPDEPVTGRVIIDTYAYYRSNDIVKPSLRALGGSEGAADPEVADQPNEDDEDAGADADADAENAEDAEEAEEAGDAENAENANTKDADDPPDNVETATVPQASPKRVEDLTPLSDDHCLLVNPMLIGFDLDKKKWGRFLVDDLRDIAWNDKAFENLVLPDGDKELAWEFVESKAKSESTFDDFVPEKGRGIIILMFGPPGVGKTFTAEAVAEKARVPLYTVSAGMLGTSPETVEPALTHALELCRLWDAMLLLDEADVFLGCRLDDSLNRNELVSIFLTKLEYYQGILFLTTNRFSRIDHAFQSRVDLFLPYRDLGVAARRQVWHNFLEHFGRDKFELAASDLDRLADLPLNGREIKNLLKTAQLLSARSGGRVKAERLYMLADKRVQALKMLDVYNEAAGARK